MGHSGGRLTAASERIAAARAALTRSDNLQPKGATEAPLSRAQERLWFVDQLEPGNPAYNMQVKFELDGPLNVQALGEAFTALVARHESLRTRFSVRDGAPVQAIESPFSVEIELDDLSSLNGADREDHVERTLARAGSASFDLEAGHLLRPYLVRLERDRHILLLVMHHIVSDGWSVGILLRELSALYNAKVTGANAALRAMPIQYSDYAVWQRTALAPSELDRQVEYWRDKLSGATSVLHLPADQPRPMRQSFRGASITFSVPAATTAALQRLGRAEGATLYMVSVAAFQVLLARWSNQYDVSVGTAIAGRNRPEFEPLIGLFVNTLVLRGDLSHNPTFRELVRRTRATALEAYANQEVPFDRLVQSLDPARDPSWHPIFQAFFALQNMPQEGLDLHGIVASRRAGEVTAAKFDVSMYLYENEAGLGGSFEYSTDLFSQATAGRMVDQYLRLLDGIATDAEVRISDLPLLSPEEREVQLTTWNDTGTRYETDRCVHDLISDRAKLHPSKPAVIADNEVLTYEDLDRRASNVCHQLRVLGVCPEVIVGVHCVRSTDLIIALLGILKAGGAYLPLDPGYPDERLRFMVEDSGAQFVLSDEETLRPISGGTRILGLKMITASAAKTESAPVRLSPNNLAYVIYTSGSTGRPKAVAGTHRGATNRVHAQRSVAPYAADDICCQKTSIGFVDSVFETIGPLCYGLSLVILDDEAARDPCRVVDGIEAHGITRLVLVPSLARHLLTVRNAGTRLKSLRSCTLSGEALGTELVRDFQHTVPGCELVNVYGSSEVTADATWFRIPSPLTGRTVPIGRPFPNTRVYVLGAYLELLPIGTPGELYVGGVGLARGYLRRADLTAERFVTSPFDPGERLYRTGDLARWTPVGELEFLGRIDQQVKVRGFRVELGEIEAVLEQHPNLSQAAVVAVDVAEAGEKRIVAYCVPNGSEPLVSELKAHLAALLPHYMMPDVFVTLERIPMTASGKIDRRSLPTPNGDMFPESYVAPRTPLEEIVASIWVEVLGTDQVSVDANFFDLGGHSLMAARVGSRIQKAFQLTMPLARLFSHPTVAQTAEWLDEQLSSEAGTLDRDCDADGPLPWLRRLQAAPGKPVLFLVHPIGGTLEAYRTLLSHLEGLQVYGLDEPPPASLDTESLVAIASAYASEIRSLHAAGPYNIAGWSYGGAIAYEVARQLAADAQVVSFVGMIDTYIPVREAVASETDRWLSFLESLSPGAAAGLELLAASDRSLEPTQDGLGHAVAGKRAAAAGLFDVYKRRLAMLTAYEPAPYPGAVTFFEATNGFRKFPTAVDWTQLAGMCKVVQLEGDHFSVLSDPAAQNIASITMSIVGSADATARGARAARYAKALP